MHSNYCTYIIIDSTYSMKLKNVFSSKDLPLISNYNGNILLPILSTLIVKYINISEVYESLVHKLQRFIENYFEGIDHFSIYNTGDNKIKKSVDFNQSKNLLNYNGEHKYYILVV